MIRGMASLFRLSVDCCAFHGETSHSQERMRRWQSLSSWKIGVGVEGLKIILTYCLTECCKESQRVCLRSI